MGQTATMALGAHLRPLLGLTQRVGSDPLLTQGSTGNSSIKVDGVLWVKASGRWMADALRDDILTPLDLGGGIGLPAAAHRSRRPAILARPSRLRCMPQFRITWCCMCIAWTRSRGRCGRTHPCNWNGDSTGCNWQWLPYVSSGLPLARAISRAVSASPDISVFVLGNHGLVVAGEDVESVETLLADLRERLAISPRTARPPDFAALREVCQDSRWDLPDDDELHTLAVDPVSRAIVQNGFLYPCQAIFSDSGASNPFRPICYPDRSGCSNGRYSDRPFLIVEGRGVLVRRSITPPELAMLSGLAQVVRRLNSSAPLRYLTDCEVTGLSSEAADRYRRLSCSGRAPKER